MDQSSEPKIGRPRGRIYTSARNIRLTTEDAADLERLAAHWRTPEAEAIRRSIRETAKREGVTTAEKKGE